MRGFQSRTGQAVLFRRAWTVGDTIALLFIAALLYVGARLALSVPLVIRGPSLSLDPISLPLYAGLSLARMVIAYLLSLVFSIGYGYWAAANRRAEQILMPLLDILQSVPILSFLPVVLLGLSAFLPQGIAAELASIILIFTSQAWNLTFAWYQSQKTVPKDLREAAVNFQFNWWLRFTKLDAPFAAIGFVWNSIMSWASTIGFSMNTLSIRTGFKSDTRLQGPPIAGAEAKPTHQYSIGITWVLALP
jgi:NitT/TauT family transport system permease protein